MKHLAPLARAALLGVLASTTALSGCSGGGGGSDGGGRMFVLSCSLGCNNGSGGSDVNCAIVNTFENQDIAIQFSEPVDLNWIQANKTAFRVIDETTGASPAGSFSLDPSDKKRLVWRPQLDFGPTGAPSYSFEPNTTYQIRVNGTSAGGAGPFVQSVGGKRNESRVLCTITTSEGLADPVPGPPTYSVFVDEIDPVSGAIQTKELSTVTGAVSTSSPITLVFNDIMNVGTVVTPISATAPFITVQTDPDGNLSDPSDQVPLPGTWSFSVDPDLLTTTAVFNVIGGLPSGANGLMIVVDVPSQVIDLLGNSVANPGIQAFGPETLIFQTVTIPPGGEQFVDQSQFDAERSSADWGETAGGFLLPGVGGGSGRLGELVVGAGDTVTLNTSPARASIAVQFTSAIVSGGSTLVIGDPLTPTTFSYKNNPDPMIPYEIQRRNTFTSQAVVETAVFLNNFVAPDPVNFPEDLVIEQATYTADGDTLIITWDTPGAAGNDAFLFDTQLSSGPYVVTPSTGLSAGGLDAVSFGGVGELGEGELLTNFDFQATPAGTPPPFSVDDGVFEFSRVVIDTNGTVVVAGDNPARLYARGLFDLKSNGLLLAAGESKGPHLSDSPFGQVGGAHGPGAGPGGRGGDRPDNTGSDLLNLPNPNTDGGIENPGVRGLNGVAGAPVPGVGVTAAGRGGPRYPTAFPSQSFLPGDLETNDACTSEQVGGPGSGGAYATDGGAGVPVAINPTALPLTLGGVGPSNTPANTVSGDATPVGLPAPGSANVGARALDPSSGQLRGGSGGGGGGASLEGTRTTPNLMGNTPPAEQADCVTIPATNPSPTPIVSYRSHSGAAGGGGGGAVQVVGGRDLIVGGVIDAHGGDGGSADPAAAANNSRATPGGGGSGGAILLQSRQINMAPVPNRLLVNGGLGGTLFDNGLAMNLSTGGDGGTGLVRAESVLSNPSFFTEIAAAINPFDASLPDQTDPMQPTAAINWLTTDTWAGELSLPGAFSAAQSCWYKPAGNFLALDFQDDSNGFGWDMDLFLDTTTGVQIVPYRNSSFYGGNSPQVEWGELYSENGSQGAPLVVRFQGAKSTGLITDPCNIDPNAAGSPILGSSVTQWVRHPAELNAFSPQPDMVRWVILFDPTHPLSGEFQGLSNLAILADPR